MLPTPPSSLRGKKDPGSSNQIRAPVQQADPRAYANPFSAHAEPPRWQNRTRTALTRRTGHSAAAARLRPDQAMAWATTADANHWGIVEGQEQAGWRGAARAGARKSRLHRLRRRAFALRSDRLRAFRRGRRRVPCGPGTAQLALRAGRGCKCATAA